MPFVGLTGGMGAGKSTALAALERLGAAVLSSDEVVHDLYGGDQLRDAVVARWGPEVAPGGAVDRAAIAQRAFASDEDRSWLERLIWPLVGARIAAWLAEVRDAHAAASRRGRRGAAAVRGRHGRPVRRDDRDRGPRARAPRARGDARARAGAASVRLASSPRTRRPGARRSSWTTTAARLTWSARCRRCLTSSSR